MPTIKKKTIKKKTSKKQKEEFVEKWNKACKDRQPPEKRFKKRGGSKFTLSLNESGLHDIIGEEMSGMGGGHHKVSGETSPFDLIDTYRAVLFFMWGIPLDAPLDKEFKKEAQKAIKRLQKEEPDLWVAYQAKRKK